MSDDQVEPKILFVQHELPPLEAGEYQLIVKGNIDDASDTQRASKPKSIAVLPVRTYRFSIYGERFRLRPGEIVKVFPPEGSHGSYAHALPHVMLSRTTLPWERSPYRSAADDPAQNKDSKDVSPWLAVLLFDQEDPSVTPRSPADSKKEYTVRDLLQDDVDQEKAAEESAQPGEWKGRLPPRMRSYFVEKPWKELLDYGETPDDPCQIIDVPLALWKRVAPSKQDLPWLAHTRTAKYNKDEQSYALVIGNRLPVAGHTSTAHLVSLEHLGDCLLDDEKPDGPTGLRKIDYIRLVSLKSWQFTTDQVEEDNFVKLLKGLTGTRDQAGRVDGLLRRPLVRGPDSESRQAEYVQDMLAQGYTALPYQTRTGHSTFSWYHGPLVPFRPSSMVDLPVDSADALVYLDTDRNVYDTSYGAAWQLGRLLALANRNFATGLYRWKLAQVQKTVQAAVQEHKLDRRQRSTFYGKLTSRLQDPEEIGQLNVEASELPADLLAWLADLYILRGIPFWYLVPDECMLPPESLRFFLVDTKWLACLIDGATSIGRASVSARTHDQVFEQKWFEQIGNAVHDRTAQSAPPRLLSGFLLRSQAVKGWWPGIRAEGYQAEWPEGPKLRQLRLELLSDSTLLALFDGEIARVTIHEPLEAIHFGWAQSTHRRGAQAAGVLDINAIAADEPKADTTAAFALKMVARAQPVVFSLERGS